MVPKSAHLAEQIDWTRPELATMKAAPDPGVEYVKRYAQLRRRDYLFEFEQKTEILDFLKSHYGAWRNFDTPKSRSFTVETPLRSDRNTLSGLRSR